MRITITSSDAAMTFMRRAGYGYQKEGGGELAFVRRVGGGEFPRYHAYVKEADSRQPTAGSGKVITINLHIDQKAPSYGRNSVHSGEYEGTLVEQEVTRLRTLAQPRDGQNRDEGQRGRESGEQGTSGGFLKRLFG